MTFQSLEITGFRNFSQLHWEPGPSLNVLEGANGQGKTNLLEALYFLAHGRSFRTRERESLIGDGREEAILAAVVDRGELEHRITCRLTPERRELTWNSKPQHHWTKVYQILQVLLFTPESTGLFRTAPASRRRYFDQAIAVMFPEYLTWLNRYQRVLRQRNQMLLDRAAPEWREPYDRQWAELTAGLMAWRQEYLAELMPRWVKRLAGLTQSVTGLLARWEGPVPQSPPPTAEQLLEALAGVAAEERRTGHTRLGPHREDLVLYWEERPVREVASQGQQRLIAIALKLAEADLYLARYGHAPVFLLDDVGSELDPQHLAALLKSLRTMDSQTVLTTAHPGEYSALEAKTFTLKGGNWVR